MAQPWLTSPGVNAGFGSAVVGYGYAMTGTTDATCALATAATAAATSSVYYAASTTATTKTFIGA